MSIPGGVREIGEGTFWGCTSLASVTISRGVTKIDGFAFHGCTSLASMSIPRSVTAIHWSSLGDNLKIQYDGTKAQWEAIEGSKLKATVQCSDGVVTVK